MTNQTIHKLLLVCLIFVSFSLTAQNDTLRSNNSIKDSATIIAPTQSLANLKMLVPPTGFVVSERFNGYIHYQASAAIIMSMIENSNFLNIEKGMTDEFFKTNHLTLIEKRNFESDHGVKGIIYKCSFVLKEKEHIRYFVYAGDLNRTLWLAITYPKSVETLMESEILKSIQTININL